MSPKPSDRQQQHMGGTVSPPCCSPVVALVAVALAPSPWRDRACIPGPPSRVHPMARPMRLRLSCIRCSSSRLVFVNFLRRGGVDIIIAPPHKSGPPAKPCPTRTGFSGKSQNEALHSTVLTWRSYLPIIPAVSPKSGAICLQRPTNSVDSWQRRLITLHLPRKRASPPRLPGNTTLRTRVQSWQKLCETCKGTTHNAGSYVQEGQYCCSWPWPS